MSTFGWNAKQQDFLDKEVYAGLVLTSPNQEHVVKLAALEKYLTEKTGRKGFTFFRPTLEGPENTVVSDTHGPSNGLRVDALEEEVLIRAGLYQPEIL